MAQTHVASYTMEAFVEDGNKIFKNEADPMFRPRRFPPIGQSKETVGGAGACFMPGDIHDTLNAQEGRFLMVRLESQKLARRTRFQYYTETATMKVIER